MILRANFGNDYSETYFSKQLTSITQKRNKQIQDYTSRVELALYRLVSEMSKNKSKKKINIIVVVITCQAQNIFIDRLNTSIRIV